MLMRSNHREPKDSSPVSLLARSSHALYKECFTTSLPSEGSALSIPQRMLFLSHHRGAEGVFSAARALQSLTPASGPFVRPLTVSDNTHRSASITSLESTLAKVYQNKQL